MGELSDEEMQEVDRLAALYPVIKDELEELRKSIVEYGRATDKAPSAEVIKNVMAAIKEEEKESFVRILGEEEEEKVKIKRVNVFPIWSIAASILFFVSLGFNIFFFGRLEKTQDELQALNQQSLMLADKVEQASQELSYADLRIAHFMNKDNIHVRMDGVELSPESYANVFWNKNTNAVFISVDNLPEPPHGHQYQLWAIKPGKAPIDAGIFDHNKLVQELKVIRGDVQAFAVTLEKEGGTPVATVEKTYVKGFLKKS
jgi:prefoldin subunit 5